jgi:predicted NUDIX family NTP pyrophosphohydrolase
MFVGAWDPSDGIASNHIEIEFPYKSNRFLSIPEADRAAWLPFEEAVTRINSSQVPMLQRAKEIMEDASFTSTETSET